MNHFICKRDNIKVCKRDRALSSGWASFHLQEGKHRRRVLVSLCGTEESAARLKKKWYEQMSHRKAERSQVQH